MPERDAEFKAKDSWRLMAILVLDYKRRVWDNLTEDEKTARGAKARNEIRLRLENGDS